MTITTNTKPRFDLNDAQRAAEAWNFNCGPGALCAVLGMTPDEIRPHLLDFESKGYTNPTLMFDILHGLSVPFKSIWRADEPSAHMRWPNFGLVRIQWAGSWMRPGVPMKARYRQTHWIAVRGGGIHDRQAFDINAMCAGGWIEWDKWAARLAPWLIRECVKGGNGDWWPTHCIEICQ